MSDTFHRPPPPPHRDPTKSEHNQGQRKLERRIAGDVDAEMVGQRLKTWRLAARLSQEQAAVAVGMKLVKLQRVERGEASPDLFQLRSLADLYGRDWGTLMDEVQPEPDMKNVPAIIAFVHPGLPAAKRMSAELEKMMAAIAEFNRPRKK